MDAVHVHCFSARDKVHKIMRDSKHAPSHIPYTRISWVCSVTQAKQFHANDH